MRIQGSISIIGGIAGGEGESLEHRLRLGQMNIFSRNLEKPGFGIALGISL